MLCIVSHPHRPQSGHITCYLNRTYHVLPTAAVAFAVSLLLGASVTAQAQTDAPSASPTDSAAPTVNVLPPLSALGARHFRNDHFRNNAVRNDPAARSRFLAELKRRADAAGASTKKASPAFGGTWQAGTNSAPRPVGVPGNPFLLTDGTVIVCDGGADGNWYKLTPDITGSYVNGTWTRTCDHAGIQRQCVCSDSLSPPPCCPMAG